MIKINFDFFPKGSDLSLKLAAVEIEPRSVSQTRFSKKRCHLLFNLIYKKYDLILDDEKYFSYGGDNYPEIYRYYNDDKDKFPDNVRFKGEAKFPEKILV